MWRILDIDVFYLTANTAFILFLHLPWTFDELAACRVTTGVTDLQLHADFLCVDVGHYGA